MLPLTIYGSQTCEDTALVRDRLRVLGIPFRARARDNDPAVTARLEQWNGGDAITPTLVFENEEIIISEPTLEELEGTLQTAGYESTRRVRLS